MKLPPPPRTVLVENPDGIWQKVHAYTNGDEPRVRWDVETGVYVINTSKASWESKGNGIWHLGSIRPTRPKLTTRVETLEGQVEMLTQIIQRLTNG